MRGNGEGKGEEWSVVQRARREEFMWMWEKYAALLQRLFLLQRGSRGPHNHRLHHRKYGGNTCGCWEESIEEEKEDISGMDWEKKSRKMGNSRNIYLKAPQGQSKSFLQFHWMKVQSLENLMEKEKSLNQCVCIYMAVRGDSTAAAARPSITLVKSMPNEDADDEARTLTHTHRRLTAERFSHP